LASGGVRGSDLGGSGRAQRDILSSSVALLARRVTDPSHVTVVDRSPAFVQSLNGDHAGGPGEFHEARGTVAYMDGDERRVGGTNFDRDEPRELTVLLADDEVAMRAGMRRSLESDGLRVVAEASTAAESVQLAVAHHPTVCLLAVNLPGNGIAAAAQINELLPETRIVMLTQFHRDEDLLESLRAGADGYLLKTTSAKRLPYAVRGVIDGEAAVPRELVPALIQAFRDRGLRRRLPLGSSGPVVELTAREFEVLEHMRHDERTATIAARLHISEVTVRRHVSAILHKLGVTDRRSALRLLASAQQRELDDSRSA